jgi:fumarylacetoacetate (FAA) hydrolase
MKLGTLKNDTRDGALVVNHGHKTGHACIAEIRALETLREGKPVTPFLKFGDRVKIEMFDAGGQSIFGAIDQQVVQHAEPR